ncbi:CACO2 protein, partial [Alopecoenas beccarii]|nr:CACO2 protein [Alopecoenas beccarii]
MDKTSDEPPTSAILLDNCHFSQVVFNNVEKFYVPGGDVTCQYTLTQNMVPHGKDWVGIFRVGWKTTREYYTFMWAPLPSDTHGDTHSDTAAQHQIQFKAYYLPKDDEYYQFCYVDQDGMVRGASVPFQFRAETEDDILVVTTQGEVEELELQNKNLREENEELKASCASLQQQNIDLEEELKKTQELQKNVESLRSNIEKLELELNSLKKENKHLKERDDCRGAELHQLKEQIENVSSDKERLASRLRAALEHMDQLQCQVLNYEKEVENLSHMNHDKTEQLESLKEENHRLRVTRTQEVNLSLSIARQTHSVAIILSAVLCRTGGMRTSSWGICHGLERVPPSPVFLRLQFQLQKEEAFCLEIHTVVRSLCPELQTHGSKSPSKLPSLWNRVLEKSRCWQCLRAASPASPRQCPMCDEVFPEDTETSQYEAHVQSHFLQCLHCSQTFDKSNKQVFDDHMLCHGLE